MFQYEELNKQFIGGKWQEGSSPNVLENKILILKKHSQHSVKRLLTM